MGPEYLLDTNSIIDFAAKRLPPASHSKLAEIIDNYPQISVINKIELLSFSGVPPEIINFTEAAAIIPLTDEVIAKTIHVRKEYKLKLPDAIIAATAIAFKLILVTRNTSDFKKIAELQMIDTYSLG